MNSFNLSHIYVYTYTLECDKLTEFIQIYIYNVHLFAYMYTKEGIPDVDINFIIYEIRVVLCYILLHHFETEERRNEIICRK